MNKAKSMKIYKIAMLVCFIVIQIGCNNHKAEKKLISMAEARKLAEKQFDAYLPQILKSHNAGLDISESYTGDFTGDGIEDVAIFFTLVPREGGNAIVGQGLTLYKNTGYEVKVIAGYDAKKLFSVDTICNGKIHIEEAEYAEGDGHCCPSIKTKRILRISGNKAY